MILIKKKRNHCHCKDSKLFIRICTAQFCTAMTVMNPGPRQCVADHSPTCDFHPSPDQPSLNLPDIKQGPPRPGPGFAQPLLGWFLSLVVLGSVSRLLNSEAWGWWKETICWIIPSCVNWIASCFFCPIKTWCVNTYLTILQSFLANKFTRKCFNICNPQDRFSSFWVSQ